MDFLGFVSRFPMGMILIVCDNVLKIIKVIDSRFRS